MYPVLKLLHCNTVTDRMARISSGEEVMTSVYSQNDQRSSYRKWEENTSEGPDKGQGT